MGGRMYEPPPPKFWGLSSQQSPVGLRHEYGKKLSNDQLSQDKQTDREQ